MTAPTPRLRLLRGDEADVFAEHELALWRSVRRAVLGPDAVVDDACSYAWLQFLRRQPERATVFPWLRTVAIHEVYGLTRRERRDGHLEQIPAWDELVGDHTDEPNLTARQLLRDIADLPPQQRRTLELLAAGHSYAEIADHLELTTHGVNSNIRRARRHLRAVQ